MKLAEVVEPEMKRYGGSVIFEPLAETVGQPGQSTDLHPHGEVLALHMGRANPRRIGISADHNWYSLHNVSRRIPLFAFARSRIDFDQLGEVATIQKRFVNG